MFQVINNIDDLREIRQELYSVYYKHEALSFFSPDYIFASLDNFIKKDKKNTLFIIIHIYQSEITHYIPLYIDGNKTLRFIFDKHTDYCSCIGPELNYPMLKELARFILDNKTIKKISLENLLPKDVLLNSFLHFFGPRTVISCYNNHSYITASSGKGFFSRLKSNEKSEIKRVQKKNESYHFEVLKKGSQFPKNQIKLLRDQMVSNGSRNRDFFEENFLSFAETLFDAGELEVFIKSDNASLISASLVLCNNYGRYKMVWIDLYADVQFISLSAYIDYIQYLEKDVTVCFSFGRGSYDFKTKNFQPKIQNLYNLRFSKSKYNLFFSYFQAIKQLGKSLIPGKA